MSYSLAGIPLKNYLVAASSPLTESLERLQCCEAAEFSAAILKSCADYDPSGNGYGRKVVYVEDGYYADGSIESEILPLEKAVELYRVATKELSGTMLLIPSVSASTLNPQKWIYSCKKFEEVGAKILQLDFFYLGTLEQNELFYSQLSALLFCLKKELSCQIMPKISIRFVPEKVFPVMACCGISTVSLLDSIREDPDESFHLHKGATSYFGPRQFPYTLQYLKIARQYDLEVCAGGGVASLKDVNILLDHGASVIQVASYILNRRFSATFDLLPDYNKKTGKDVLLTHNPWCDYKEFGKCMCCGGCAPHKLP